MDSILNIIENSSWPVLTAFLLGLAVAVHPCPLATNIAAMGYIARHASDSRKVLVNGLYYTLGRIVAYSALGAAIVLAMKSGAATSALGGFFGEWGERLLAPFLIIIGVYFLFAARLHKEEHCPNVATRGGRLSGRTGSFALGAVLALSFCPESAIVYFGMLMPLSAKATAGYALPAVFSVATAVPTVLMAWAVAYGVAGSDTFKKNAATAQRLINAVVGVLFIGAGLFCYFF